MMRGEKGSRKMGEGIWRGRAFGWRLKNGYSASKQ